MSVHQSRLAELLAALIFLIAASMPATAVVDEPEADPSWPAPRARAAPNGQHGFPFMASTLKLSRSGFIEQEFLISGVARAYIPATPLQPDGHWKVKPNAGVTVPYTTRILVRRPANPDRFNGTVLVEWLNESGGFDTPSEWLHTHDEILREGYAYVGVTAQFVGAQALRGWESGPGARYANVFHPGDSFAYDIFAQAGWVVTHARGGDARPLGNLTGSVRTVLAAGFSQSAIWLTTYVNAIHRLSPIYDGFLIHDGGFGSPLSIDTASPNGDPIPGNVPPTPFIDTPYPMHLRTDLQVPTLALESEFGLSDFGVGAARSFHLQRDSGRFRVWEIAGAPHLETGWFREFVADVDRSIPGFALGDCTGPSGIPSIIHSRVARAALQALTRWAADGRVPGSAPRISLVVPNPPDSFDELVTFNRDPTTHLAIGGIRLPDLAVPIATLNGNRSELDPQVLGPGAQCGLVGSYDRWNRDADSWDGQSGLDPSPTPEPDLQILYRNHLSYIERVTSSTLQNVRDGYLRPADAIQIVVDAVNAAVP